LIRGRGNGYVREASPLFDSPLVLLSIKGGGGILEEGLRPSWTPPDYCSRVEACPRRLCP